jgi:ParB family chromosome partitioning protein
MNATAELDAPQAETPAVAAPSPELIASEWGADGQCTNPEVVSIDFGAKRGQREATFLLGSTTEGQWYVGWTIATKTGERHTEPCALANMSFAHRNAALRIALAKAETKFEGDAMAVRACSAMFSKTFGAQPSTAVDSSAPNTPMSDSRPLPAAMSKEIPVRSIQRNPDQPRQNFSAEKEKELAESITSVGLLQPILVRQLLPEELAELPGINDVERYEIIAGERRWRAHQRLERETIAARVYAGLTRAQAAAAALIENLQREDLNPIEESEGYRRLMQTEGLTQEQCAQRVGKSRPVIANALRVLELPEKVIAYIREGKLTPAHGTALARFKNWPQVASIIAEEAVKDGEVSSAELEEGLPYSSELVAAGVAANITAAQFDWTVPPSITKHASYIKDSDAGYMLDVEAFKILRKEWCDKKREAEQKVAEKQAKKKASHKTLEQLRQSVAVVAEDREDMALELLPDDSINTVRRSQWDDTKVTVCTHATLAKRVDEELVKMIEADRAEKYGAAVEQAQKKIAAIKKIGSRELALLLVGREIRSDWNDRSSMLSATAAKTLGVKVPAVVDGKRLLKFKLVESANQVDLLKIWLQDWLCSFEPKSLGRHPNRLAAIRFLLDVEDIELLESSAEGQKQLVAAVKAQEWYQRELAKIEGREFVAPAAAAAKPSAKEPAKAKGAGRAVITDATHAEVLRLCRQEKTGAEIAKAVGISLPSVQNIKKALGLVRR